MSSVNDLLYPKSYVKEDQHDIPVWYEFLLRPDYLDQHLSQTSPEPSGCDLIKDFFFQVNIKINYTYSFTRDAVPLILSDVGILHIFR